MPVLTSCQVCTGIYIFGHSNCEQNLHVGFLTTGLPTQMKVGQVLRDARALLSSQLNVKKARLVTWSAAPLSEKIRTSEHLLKESPVVLSILDSMCETLSRVALRRNRPESVMVYSRKFQVERGAGIGARVEGREQGNYRLERAMSAIPARVPQLGFGGPGKLNRPRAQSAMASVGSASVASHDIDLDPLAKDEVGRATIDIKDTVWGSLSSFSGLGRTITTLVPEIEGEMTRPTTSQSDRKSACPASLCPSSPGPSLLDSADRLQPFAALSADASASPCQKMMKEKPALLDHLHDGALTAGIRCQSCTLTRLKRFLILVFARCIRCKVSQAVMYAYMPCAHVCLRALAIAHNFCGQDQEGKGRQSHST